MSAFNSTAIQRNRILNYLRKDPLDTLIARKDLDVMHPASRVMELRSRGININTIMIDRTNECGEIHRVACYLMEYGAVAPAPVDKAYVIHRLETDNSKYSTEGN
ncbi:MAG: helix-turn-helix domain-containing protein [Nitrosomonas sp.]|nr:helix-turn-helix domain-containing protein [Nitrosomonas sp.]